MPQVRSWWWILAAIPAILILRIAGFIGNFWAGLGIVALLAFLVLLQMFPTTLQRWIAIAFIGWVVIFLTVPALWNAFLAPRPLLREALERRGVANDLQASELADPVALRARLGIAKYCRMLEELRGKEVSQALQRMLDVQKRSLYGDSARATLGLAAKTLRQIEKDREECKRLILPAVPQPKVTITRIQIPELSQTEWLWVAGIGFGLLIILGAFIPALRGAIWSLAVLIAILVAIGWILGDGKLPGIAAAPPPAATKPAGELVWRGALNPPGKVTVTPITFQQGEEYELQVTGCPHLSAGTPCVWVLDAAVGKLPVQAGSSFPWKGIGSLQFEAIYPDVRVEVVRK
jgi:hypothetical protein